MNDIKTLKLRCYFIKLKRKEDEKKHSLLLQKWHYYEIIMTPQAWLFKICKWTYAQIKVDGFIDIPQHNIFYCIQSYNGKVEQIYIQLLSIDAFAL